MGAPYSTLFEAAQVRRISRYDSSEAEKTRAHKEALKRRVERAMKQADEIEGEIKRQSGLTLEKASAAQIAKAVKDLADEDKYPLPER